MLKKEEAIIKGCLKGNQIAQMQLYDLYCNTMLNIVCRYLKNREDAKDVMQESFLKAFNNIQNYNKTYPFSTWLKRIMINNSIDYLRKKKIDFVDIDANQLSIIDDNDWSINSGISKESVINAIDELSTKYQLVLKLYLIEGYNHEEIAQILDIPIKTSRTHLRRGKLQLQDLLKNII